MRENSAKQIELLPVGRKGRDFFRRRQFTLVGEYVGLDRQRAGLNSLKHWSSLVT